LQLAKLVNYIKWKERNTESGVKDEELLMSLPQSNQSSRRPRVLHAYLLGRLDFDTWLALQRHLVFEVSLDRSIGALVLCEHPHTITVGREGSAGHILIESEELQPLGWPVRWINRGGGCLLHSPGQMAAYPILALDWLGMNVQQYLDKLHETIRATLTGLDVPAEVRLPTAGLWAGDRRIAHVGIAVTDWIAYHGFSINVETNLKLFRHVRCDGDERPMTSIQRERRTPVRPSTVRQRLLAEFLEQFGFDRVSIFHEHSFLTTKVPSHAVATRSR
jgi:lipoyl(octanoyl) transferase